MNIENKLTDFSFETTNFVHSRAQVLSWIGNGTSLIHIFEKNASDLLSSLIKGSDVSKSVVVNFNGITAIDEHALDSIFKALNDNIKQLVIVNGFGLAQSIFRLKKEFTADIHFDSANKSIVIGNSRVIDYGKLDAEREEITQKIIRTTLSSTFKKFDAEQRLCSTPIVANGEFNSTEVISDPNKFKWMVFFLSDRLNEIIQNNRLENVKLLSASLRGAPFAAMLGIINDLEFETIDHFGPKHKVFDFDFIRHQERGINYIYIGDFAFGGTEIKIAKTYVEMKSSKLMYALVLGSLFEKSAFINDFDLNYLSDLKSISEGVAEFKLFA